MPLTVHLHDGSTISPDRDIRLMYQAAIQYVKAFFEQQAWPDLMAWLESTGVEWGDIEEALNGYILFLNGATRDPTKNMHQVLQESGFLNTHPAAQIAIMAMLGRVVTGQFFDSVRSSTPLGETMSGLQEIMRQGLLELRTGLPKRKSWLKSLWASIRGRAEQ